MLWKNELKISEMTAEVGAILEKRQSSEEESNESLLEENG
jgi:hypothetical protein